MKLAPAHIAFFIFIITYPSCIRLTSPSIYTEQSPERAWQRLAELKSFHFTLRYQTSSPTEIVAQFSGRWESPDRESWRGYQKLNRLKKNLIFRAQGDRQFTLTDSGWQIQTRGLETSILKQIEQLLNGARLTYLNEDNHLYRYQFNPRFLIIAPLKSRDLTGILEIEKRTGLPITIHCFNEQKETEWLLKLHHFNRKGKIEIPFVPAMTVELRIKNCPPKIWEYHRTATIIRRRLNQLGIAARIKWQIKTFKITIDHILNPTLIELLTTKGKTQIWIGEWAENKYPHHQDRPILPLLTDPAKKVILKTSITTDRALTASVIKNHSFPPKLAVSIPAPINLPPDGLSILTIDQIPISASDRQEQNIDSGGTRITTILFTDIENEQLLKALAALINSRPLPVEFHRPLTRNTP